MAWPNITLDNTNLDDDGDPTTGVNGGRDQTLQCVNAVNLVLDEVDVGATIISTANAVAQNVSLTNVANVFSEDVTISKATAMVNVDGDVGTDAVVRLSRGGTERANVRYSGASQQLFIETTVGDILLQPGTGDAYLGLSRIWSAADFRSGTAIVQDGDTVEVDTGFGSNPFTVDFVGCVNNNTGDAPASAALYCNQFDNTGRRFDFGTDAPHTGVINAPPVTALGMFRFRFESDQASAFHTVTWWARRLG